LVDDLDLPKFDWKIERPVERIHAIDYFRVHRDADELNDCRNLDWIAALVVEYRPQEGEKEETIREEQQHSLLLLLSAHLE